MSDFKVVPLASGRVVAEAAARLSAFSEEQKAERDRWRVDSSIIRWQWSEFSALSVNDLYEAIALRERVFCVEQSCVYLDCDGKDPKSCHLLGWWLDPNTGEEKLIAYLRVLPAGLKFPDVSIGRAVVAPECRRQGIGSLLLKEGINCVNRAYGAVPVRISAQAHLEKFYSEFGFKTDSDVYLEDDIPHVGMIRS